MIANSNQPREHDVVLGGLEGVKQRLASGNIGHRMSALSEAFNYGQAGLNLVFDILKDESDPIHPAAYLLLKERSEQQVKQALESYYGNQPPLLPHLFYSCSCSLRRPINGLIGFIRLVLEGLADDPEEEREFLQEADRAAVHLLNYLNNMLDAAKIDAAKIELYPMAVKLEEVFTKLENEKPSWLHQNQLNFHIIRPTTPTEIVLYTDYLRLLQVIQTLLFNAYNYHNQEGITIKAEIIPEKVSYENQEFAGILRFEIINTGISPDFNLNHAQNGADSYLELFISKRLVEAMGGQINVYSSGEGLGSTVAFTVPANSWVDSIS